MSGGTAHADPACRHRRPHSPRYGLRELVAQHPDIQLVAECGSAADAQRVLEAAAA
jgi:hypothetical protein